jgi:hypothetical protein
MSDSSQEDRDRMKEEYKDHYRRIRDAKEKFRSSSYAKKAGDAVRQMNADDLLNSVDHFMGKLRFKMASIESKLDLAMDDIINDDEQKKSDLDEEMKKEKAKETLRQIKQEMGMLYDDLEQQAEEMNVKKTVGPHPDTTSDSPSDS